MGLVHGFLIFFELIASLFTIIVFTRGSSRGRTKQPGMPVLNGGKPRGCQRPVPTNLDR